MTKEDKKMPMTQEEKREAMIFRLDTERRAFLQEYFDECKALGEKPNFEGLMLNGMGVGAGDLYDNESLDALIAADEQVSAGAEADE